MPVTRRSTPVRYDAPSGSSGSQQSGNSVGTYTQRAPLHDPGDSWNEQYNYWSGVLSNPNTSDADFQRAIEGLRRLQNEPRPSSQEAAQAGQPTHDGSRLVLYPDDYGNPMEFIQYDDADGQVRLYDDAGYIYRWDGGELRPMGGARVNLDAQGRPLNPMTGQIARTMSADEAANRGVARTSATDGQNTAYFNDRALAEQGRAIQQQIEGATARRTGNAAMSGAIGNYNTVSAQADRDSSAALASLRSSGTTATNQINSYVSQLQRSAAQGNQQALAALNSLGTSIQGYNAADRAALGTLAQQTNPLMSAIQMGGYGPDVQASAEGRAAQQAGLGNAAGIFGGALDITSQAAGAYADPAAIARQLRALDALERDVTQGGTQQQEVVDRYRALTTPEMTAQERAILDAGNRSAAAADYGRRSAVQQQLAQRGLNSGAAIVAGNQAANSFNADQAAQAVVGAQANAVARSMAALQGMGTAATALRAGDANAASNFYTGSSNYAQQTFDQAYRRGLAADQASMANQSTRLAGNGQMIQAADSLRTADDRLAMFNREQSQITMRAQAQLASQEAGRIGNLSLGVAGLNLQANQAGSARAFGLNDATQTTLNNNFGRDTTAANTGITGANTVYGINQGYANTALQAANNSAGRAATGVNVAQQGVATRTAMDGTYTPLETDAWNRVWDTIGRGVGASQIQG